VPVEELLGELSERSRALTRRELLVAGAGVASTALVCDPALSLARSLTSRTALRIAIVGGGLAGLSCAYRLWNAIPNRPLASTVYEANPQRAGGRCWTLRDYFDAGLSTEHGGAFLNSDQRAVRHLAHELGLQQEQVDGGELRSGEAVYLIDGQPYTFAQASSDWKHFGYAVFERARRASEGRAGAAALDAQSVTEWLEGTEIGTSSRFGKLMLADAVTENGGDPEAMSALDLVELVTPTRSHLNPAGDDERFHILGGNDQLVSGMLERLPPSTLQLGERLISLRANGDGSSTLAFESGAATRTVKADVVVLALPFTMLRQVDLSRSGLSPAKLRVIDTFAMGSNAKIHVELERKVWPELGYNGVAYSEWDGFCCAWDDSVPLGADASPALYVGFPGGRTGLSGLTGAAHGPAPAGDVSWLLAQLEQLFPGITATYTGRAYEDHWALDPYTLGAYSYLGVGQATSYGRLAAQAEGKVHFAGEHTSTENEGFLDGAVESGERAAREIMRSL